MIIGFQDPYGPIKCSRSTDNGKTWTKITVTSTTRKAFWEIVTDKKGTSHEF